MSIQQNDVHDTIDGVDVEQTESIFGSNTTLRPDVISLGFHSFHDEFDPEQVLIIYSVSQDEVEILFFHPEGMALLFGVGLSFSRVLLREDCVVKVQELRPQVWMKTWSISETSKFTPLLFDSSTLSGEPFNFNSLLENTVYSFSPEQAAEQFGVGVEGADNFIRMGQFQHDVSDVAAVSPSWIAGLYDLLSCSGRRHVGNDIHGKDMVSKRNECNITTTIVLSVSSSSDFIPDTSPDGDLHRIQGQEQEQLEWITHERGMQSTNLQLTVLIYLDSEGCTFFPRTYRVGGEMCLDRESESGIPRFVNCQTGEVLSHYADLALYECVMVPEVTTKFLYDPRNGNKMMKTTLDVNFLIDGKVCDPEKFGWYHDQLRLSFKSLLPKEVRRGRRELKAEILSEVEFRDADRGSGTAKMSAVCLKEANFSVVRVGGISELAYRAVIFPSFYRYDPWNVVHRDYLHNSGIMSSVPIRIEGDWYIRDDYYTSTSSAGRSEQFCRYEFLCARELKLLRTYKIGRVYESGIVEEAYRDISEFSS